jgi:hypothetical protein
MESWTLDRNAMREILDASHSLNGDIKDMVERALEGDDLPDSISVSMVSTRNIHDVYVIRQDSARNAGIEVIAIESFLETMAQYGNADVGGLSIEQGDYKLLLVLDVTGKMFLAGVAVRNA